MELDKTKNFLKAISSLEEGNIKYFGQILVELSQYLQCDCFFKTQIKINWDEYLSKIETVKDSDDYYFNLGKGFIYFKNLKFEDADFYLTKAIEVNPLIDLAYSLRYLLGSKYNWRFKKDIKNAVLLNPSAGNFYLLARNVLNDYENTGIKKSIIYLKNSISFKPNCICSYKLLGYKYLELKDYNNAIIEFNNCILFDKTCEVYGVLYENLLLTKRFREAINVAKLGYKSHPQIDDYLVKIGTGYKLLGKYSIALFYFKRCLNQNPNNYNVNKEIIETHKRIANKILLTAKKHFNLGDFVSAKNSFPKDFITSHYIFGDDLILYFKIYLKNNNPQIKFEDENELFIRLKNLKIKYNTNLMNRIEPSEEETNAKNLKAYKDFDELNFGKYNGKRVSEVISHDPDYLIWCIINLDHFSLDPRLFLETSLNPKLDNYSEALATNVNKSVLIKNWLPERDEDNQYYVSNQLSYEDWLVEEYGDDASTAYWNHD